jgi:broad specificity phosphatase PhoE
MPSNVYLARHAAPDRFNTTFVYHQLPGPPLTEQGVREAQALGAYLRSVEARRIYSSPFERCLRTAEIAAGAAGINWQVEERLGEVQPGEALEDVLRRVQPAFDRFAQESASDGPVVLVTHGGVVSALLLHLGMEADALKERKVFDYGNPLPPAGAWLAERDGVGTGWNLRLAFQPEAAAVSA